MQQVGMSDEPAVGSVYWHDEQQEHPRVSFQPLHFLLRFRFYFSK